ncbi:sulfotransferase family 2 domain-containing protein [Candidatus Leptofilum sp.]|uniref:sulfotransferase family 2 domain-containing protein n=1 Tax=Candidatus Leptofilum sp. TaxID=3241576 RepID=UPI003B5A6BD7
MAHKNETPATVIYLHIPKTAGSTLHAIHNQIYAPEQVLHLKGDPHIDTAVAQFKQLSNKAKQSIRLLTGHIEYGLHEWLPQPATYFTILRDPIERVLSYYYFILRTPDHPRHEEMTGRQTSIADFAKHILGHNNQTRFLAGTWLEDLPCTAKTLSLAKQHILQDFSVVGLSEQFDTTLLLLKHQFNWPRLPYYRSRNVTKNRPNRQQLDDQTLAIIHKTQAYDLELYAFAQKQFEERVRQMRFPFWLSRIQHQLHQRTYPSLEKIRRVSVRHWIRQQWQKRGIIG